MAQWVGHLRNNIFVSPPPLPLLCEISGSLHLVQPGLTADRLAGRQNTEIFCTLVKIFDLSLCNWYSIITALSMHSSRFYWVKPIARLIFEV